jgi:hypothetical protein
MTLLTIDASSSTDELSFPITKSSDEANQFTPNLPQGLKIPLPIVLGNDNQAYAVIVEDGNKSVIRINSKKFETIVYSYANKQGIRLTSYDVKTTCEQLTATAELKASVTPIWSRVAPSKNGIEIDAGNYRIVVTAGNVEVDHVGSNNLFYKNPVSLPMVRPVSAGNIGLLKKYMNLSKSDLTLLIAWISYTLAHPKIKTSKFLILVIHGDQGSGKSFACENIIIPLIDPSVVGIQVFPSNVKDFTIAAQNSHVLCYDNMRNFKHKMADILCMASTGGTITSRALYTNDDQHVQRLHVPLVLNGIHQFINESDLAERCLTIRPQKIIESQRRSEDDMTQALKIDLPIIFRGLLDLIANIFEKLPEAIITHPQRMLDFVQWLAATELVDGVEEGTYQAAYAEMLNQSQLDSLLENLLASTVVEFTSEDVMKSGKWSGTPSALLNQLNNLVSLTAIHSREWPNNPIALSKRLNSLKASLLSQGISVEFNRGKERTITIEVLARPSNPKPKPMGNLDDFLEELIVSPATAPDALNDRREAAF